ncbi:hypothetical protein AB3S75_045304 [Citrus x aurantiifolia]
MFQFARLSLAYPWIQQQFERLTYSGISGSTLIFNSPKHFVAYYPLPRLWVPRYPSQAFPCLNLALNLTLRLCHPKVLLNGRILSTSMNDKP